MANSDAAYRKRHLNLETLSDHAGNKNDKLAVGESIGSPSHPAKDMDEKALSATGSLPVAEGSTVGAFIDHTGKDKQKPTVEISDKQVDEISTSGVASTNSKDKQLEDGTKYQNDLHVEYSYNADDRNKSREIVSSRALRTLQNISPGSEASQQKRDTGGVDAIGEVSLLAAKSLWSSTTSSRIATKDGKGLFPASVGLATSSTGLPVTPPGSPEVAIGGAEVHADLGDTQVIDLTQSNWAMVISKRIQNTTAGSSVQLQVHPQQLGPISLQVSAGPNGSLSVAFHSDNSQTRDLLLQSIPQIQQGLSSSGLTASVTVSSGGFAGFDSGLQERSQEDRKPKASTSLPRSGSQIAGTEPTLTTVTSRFESWI